MQTNTGRAIPYGYCQYWSKSSVKKDSGDLESAARFRVKDRQVVSVKIAGERGGGLGNVLVRVHPAFKLELHIDTDEANAVGLSSDTLVELVH